MAIDSHAALWARLSRHRRPRSPRDEVVHVGLVSSCVFLVLMFADVLAPAAFQSHYVAIGVIYLLLQLAEIAARDPLSWTEVFKSHFFSFAPALGGLVIEIWDWATGGGILTPVGREVMHLWLVLAWAIFVFSIAVAMRTLSAPYRRSESLAPRD